MFFINILEDTQYFRNRIFAIGFLVENINKFKKFVTKFFKLIYFGVISQRVFVDFSVSFQYFLKRVLALKFALKVCPTVKV